MLRDVCNVPWAFLNPFCPKHLTHHKTMCLSRDWRFEPSFSLHKPTSQVKGKWRRWSRHQYMATEPLINTTAITQTFGSETPIRPPKLVPNQGRQASICANILYCQSQWTQAEEVWSAASNRQTRLHSYILFVNWGFLSNASNNEVIHAKHFTKVC